MLNEAQRKGVVTTEGRVLILAGAGSGKTRVLVHRMAHLIREKGVDPSRILGLTFTNKAAREMQKRMGDLIDRELAKKVWLSTFHSFCLKVLREDIAHLGYTRHFTLWDTQDVERVVKTIVRDLLSIETELPSLTPTLSAIARMRSDGVKSKDLQEYVWHDAFVKQVYDRLKEAFRAYNALDFDGLLLETTELFESFPEVLKKWQERFRYIMIDEYQDTNPVQFRLTELLAASHGNLCVVGDDDQSIYGWRGASIQNILSFENATCIKLEENFRSTSTILEAANHIIRHNHQRHSKRLWSQKGEGSRIEIFHAPTEVEEAEAVVARIVKMREALKVSWSHFAILYRSNSLSRQMEMALLKAVWKEEDRFRRGIPYQVFGGLEFYERKEVKDLIAYMKAIVNPKDEEALLRIINYPRRGIGEGSLDQLTAYSRREKVPLWEVLKHPPMALPEKAKKGVVDFVDLLQEAKIHFQGSLKEALLGLIEKLNYRKALEEEVKSQKMQDFKWENVEELILAVAECQEGSLEDFLAGSLLDQKNWTQEEHDSQPHVSLMTFHSAKGLEFPYCFLVGLEDHIIPHERSLKEGSLEEERRLMYVALTRAQDKLILSMARQRKKMGQETLSAPSRFLLDIPKELLKAVRWDEI
jgi:superfamily I DNA/RNA helicase